MKIIVTAGPTREAIDPVRFLSNRSSGKMGYAIAEAALKRGHTVRLISGPVSLLPPPNARMYQVESAADMLQAVVENFAWCDALIMSAAVADWRPVHQAEHKLKKCSAMSNLKLERTTDILQTVAPQKSHQIIIGFAAETKNLIAEARRKLSAKNMDMIIANDVSREDAGFAVDTNAASIITQDSSEDLPLMQKSELALEIIQRLEKLPPANNITRRRHQKK